MPGSGAPEPTPAPTRALPGARVVALALIAVLVAGLGYLRLTADPSPVSVPAGARAGDLVLEPCSYATENGAYAADCGTLVVPENRADPGTRLTALPVTRIRARSADPGEPIFRLEGGPGQSNMAFRLASRYAEKHDVVLVGYRGVDGSVRLDCPEVSSALKRSTDALSEQSFRDRATAYRACANRLAGDGVDLAAYGLVQQVDDMEDARVALGYDRVNLMSESAGTRTAMIYAWRYPQSIHRSVMIGVNPPGNFLWDPRTTDELIDRYAALCAKDDACSSRTGDLADSLRRITADLPDRWLFLPIDDSNVRVATMFGLFETTPSSVASAPKSFDAWLSAAEGDASGLWFTSVFADVFFPEMFVYGQYAAAARVDAGASREYFSTRGPELNSNYGYAATSFGWGGGQLTDAWPAALEEDEYSRVRTSQVETLLISGALDFSTPPQKATAELLPHLPNGHQVVLPAFGHTSSFWTDQPEAGTRLVGTFFDSGRVDDSLYEPQRVDFTPSGTHGALAKRVVGGMLLLGAAGMLSLLWLVWHVRRRGRVGVVASALLRSLYPLALGLGGWSLGVLVVLATTRGVSVDNQLVAVLAIGIPVAPATYLAWVDLDRSGTRSRGFAAATAGALVGAWLGFHAVGGFLTVVTAAAGAAAGANLALIGLDIGWAWSSRRRVGAVRPPAAPTPPVEAVVPEPRPAT